MKWNVTVIALFVTVAINAQVKDDISVVQYSAKFNTDNELNIKELDEVYNETLYMSDNSKIFKKEKITYLPTIIVYQDGEEMLRVEAGIDLKLPEGTLQKVKKFVDELLSVRF